MSQKRLWQVKWDKGVTDGDVGETTVRELLNVEMDRPGHLYPRDEIVQDTSTTIAGLLDVVTLSYSPSGDEYKTVFNITGTNIYIADGYSSWVVPVPAGVTGIYQAVGHGDRLYMTCYGAGDVRLGTAVLWWDEGGDTFESYYGYGGVDPSGTVSSGWKIEMLDSSTPDLYVSWTPESLIDGLTAAEALNAVAIYPRASVIGNVQEDESAFVNNCVIEYAAQFVYRSGTVSPLSTRVRERFTWATTDQPFRVDLSICVDETIGDTVESVNIFRRIIENNSIATDTEMELFSTARVVKDAILDLEREISPETLSFTDRDFGDYYQISGTGLTVNDNTLYTRTMTSTGTAKETSGWIEDITYTSVRIWAGNMVAYTGSIVFRGENSDPTSMNYNESYSDVVLLIGYLGNDSLQSPVLEKSNCFNASNGGDTITIGGGFWPPEMGFIIDTGPAASTSGWVSPSSSYSGSGSDSGWNTTVDYNFPDIGAPSLFTERDVFGLTDDERADVKPKYLAMLAGRMFLLNCEVDGKIEPAKLMYSEFRKFWAVSKESHINYGNRDDGAGRGIMGYKGRMLALHDTAAYYMDVSGGTDLLWRELGSMQSIGLLNYRCIVSSPIGLFFGDANNAYHFDGARITPICDFGDKSVRDRYRDDFVADGVTPGDTMVFLWRSDLRQLYIAAGNKALVLDVDRGAWHNHIMDEFGDDESFYAMYNDKGVERIAAWDSSGTATLRVYDLIGTGATRPFDWGIETGPITMGSSEFVKKLKRIYLDLDGETSTLGDVSVWVTDMTGAADLEITPGSDRASHRLSSSARGYSLMLKVMALADYGVGVDESWTGKLESLGLTYKPKKLK